MAKLRGRGPRASLCVAIAIAVGSLADVVPPPPGQSVAHDLSCSSVADAGARAAWVDLRTWLGRVPLDSDLDLPGVVFQSSLFGGWMETKSGEGGADAFPWLRPLGPREECRLGRWSGWLVLAERDADGAMPSQLRRLVTEAGAPSPLEELLLPAGAPSVLRWEDVGDSTWCFFSLLHRVAPSLVQPQQVALPPDVAAALADVRALVGRPEQRGPTRRQKAEATQRLEVATRRWAGGLGTSGLDRALQAVHSAGLFAALHRLWLPDAVLLRMPDALAAFDDEGRRPPLDPRLLEEERFRGGDCGRFRHRRGLHGLPRGYSVVVAPYGPMGGRAPAWRCSIVSRLMRSDHLISAKVRSFGQLDCGRDVLHTLWQQGLAVAASGTLARKFRYVDVGASLGDCSLAAAALLPWGALSAVAFDADSRVIGLLREAAQMNGLSGGRANDSSLVARLALLGDEADLRKPADIEVDEHIGVVVADGESGPRGARLASRVPRSTLDAELAGFTADADVDVLSIHGNGFFESAVLRGAGALLAGGRIRCVLVTCGAVDGCEAMAALLQQRGYRTEESLDWVLASPASLLEATGGDVCGPGLVSASVARLDL